MINDSIHLERSPETIAQMERINHLLSVNSRLLRISRECQFEDLEGEIRAEIAKLKGLRRLARTSR